MKKGNIMKRIADITSPIGFMSIGLGLGVTITGIFICPPLCVLGIWGIICGFIMR